jgi:cell division protein FtsN
MNCEFEIKGDDRKECPICGGFLIDYSEVEASSEEIKSTGKSDRWEETLNESKETTPFNLEKALEVDGDHPIQEPEEHIPLSSQSEPGRKSESTLEERSAEDAEFTAFDKSTWETDRGKETLNESKETASFDLGKALEVDDDHPIQESDEYIPLPSQLEPELESEGVDTARSTEEVITDTPESYNNLPEQIIAAAQQSEIESFHSSGKQLAISVMAVLALVAAITTIAIFKPQQNFYPVIGHLKVKTEKTVVKILSMVTQREEKRVVARKTPERSTRFQQRQRELTAGNVDPDKKLSRLEELSSGGKGKGATAKKQLKPAHSKPLAQQETNHARIASLKETSPPLVGKDMQSFEMKRSTKNTLERETVLVKPVVKKTSRSSLYSIHAGSFKDKEVAVGEIDRLKKMGFHAYIQTVDLENGQTWHRIKVGSYSTREEAENTQNELRQKLPKRKSYIMRRVTETKKTATQREGETSISAAGSTSFVAGQVKRELPHVKADVLETVPPLKENVAPKIEQLLTEMKAASYLTPPLEEAPQAVSEGVKALPLLKESLVPELEQLITEMGGDPYTTPLVEEEKPVTPVE